MAEREPQARLSWQLKTVGAVTSLALAASGCGKSENTHFKGGCKPFVVYAQNRWTPVGAAERDKPDRSAQKIDGYDGNETITVDGWVHTGVAVYPNNQPPFNNDVWFHDANKPHGFIGFAGVRAELTTPDPTLQADGGPAVMLQPACEGNYQK